MNVNLYNDKRLLIISDDPIIKVKNEYYSSTPIIYFWSEISKYFKRTYLFFPIKECTNSFSIFLHPFSPVNNINIINRTFYISKKEALLKFNSLFIDIKKLYQLIKKHEELIIIYKLPSILFIPFYLLCINRIYYKKKRIIFYIAGDIISRTYKATLYIKLLAKLYDIFLKKCKANNNIIKLATGNHLAKQYDAYLFDISLIRESEIKDYYIHNRNDETFNILFVGRLDYNKGVDILLEAFALLLQNSKLTNLQLIIVGNGPEKDKLIQLAHNRKLYDKVKFVKGTSYLQVKKFFLTANVFVLPSRSEGVPKVLYEAMAYTVPIIATRVGGIPNLTQNGKAAFLIEPENITALYNAILEISYNSNKRLSFIKAGLEIIKENTLEKKIKELLDILQS